MKGKFTDRFYPETLKNSTPTLKNKLNIRDNAKLAKKELFITSKNFYTIDSETVPGNWDLPHLMKYHKKIFDKLYDWAGKLRTFGVEKSEEKLQGHSVEYSDPEFIITDINKALREFKQHDYQKMDIEEQSKHFSKAMVGVWQAHAFDEGNTRTTTKFMCDLAKEHNINLDVNLFTRNNEYFRNAMVMYTVGRENFLEKIVSDSIERANSQTQNQIGIKDLTMNTLNYVRNKVPKEAMVDLEFNYKDTKFKILDLAVDEKVHQAQAVIKNCDTQELFLEKNFAGKNPFSLDLKVKVPNNFKIAENKAQKSFKME